jgi:hypothetical protein
MTGLAQNFLRRVIFERNFLQVFQLNHGDVSNSGFGSEEARKSPPGVDCAQLWRFDSSSSSHSWRFWTETNSPGMHDQWWRQRRNERCSQGSHQDGYRSVRTALYKSIIPLDSLDSPPREVSINLSTHSSRVFYEVTEG